MTDIKAISAFNDNYIWAICHPANGRCAVVDPGDGAPVLDFLARESLQLEAILVTHHHGDHTGGINRLLGAAPLSPDFAVIGPCNPAIGQVTRRVADGDRFTLAGLALTFDVLAVPGHTLDHLAFHAPGLLFCGDTLFSGGCGRLFEGTPAQLHRSLTTLANLDPRTAVYCAHEYTLANLAFARAVEPDNADLRRYLLWCQQQRQHQRPTLPSSIERELQINPFLRTQTPSVRQAIIEQFGQVPGDDSQALGMLRQWKDGFRI